MHTAVIAGLALSTGYLLTGGALSLLKESELKLTDGKLILKLHAKSHMLNAEVVTKALNKLAKAMEREAVIEV